MEEQSKIIITMDLKTQQVNIETVGKSPETTEEYMGVMNLFGRVLFAFMMQYSQLNCQIRSAMDTYRSNLAILINNFKLKEDE